MANYNNPGELPTGIHRAILHILQMHMGELRAISRDDLVSQVGLAGIRTTERQARLAIHQLRREGYLICAMAGEGGGYYMAQTSEEYAQFRKREYAAKISDMSETMSAMDNAARRQFGGGFQAWQESLL